MFFGETVIILEFFNGYKVKNDLFETEIFCNVKNIFTVTFRSICSMAEPLFLGKLVCVLLYCKLL